MQVVAAVSRLLLGFHLNVCATDLAAGAQLQSPALVSRARGQYIPWHARPTSLLPG